MYTRIYLVCLIIAGPVCCLKSLDALELLTRSYGLEFRTYRIITEDRYLLTLFRINGKSEGGVRKRPVLLHHGLISTAASFMMNGNKSLAFYLARKGYDVWLANHRGNNFSPGHAYLQITDPKYWDFSFHEIGVFDIPAIVEFIYRKSGSKIHYIGHSMGTTISFVYGSMRSKHAQKYLINVIALAPVASMKYSLTGLKSVLPFVDHFLQSLLSTNVTVIFPNPEKLSRLVRKYCSVNTDFCSKLFTLFNGDNHEFSGMNITKLLDFNPARTSMKCLAHYVQMLQSKYFQQYDYRKANYYRYNMGKPPVYNLANIKVPVHLFYSLGDIFVSRKDAIWIYNQLRVRKSLNLVPSSTGGHYYHTDYVLAKDVEKQLHRKILHKIY